MKVNLFQKLLKELENLTYTQSKQAEDVLHKKCSLESLEDVTGYINECPHCQSQSFYKWGVRANLQRYRCNSCHKTFNSLTNTPLARLRHKEMWIDYAKDIIDGESIQHAAKHCKVANSTAFRWRHRMLTIPNKLKAQHLNGIVEFDETYFLESQKGNHQRQRWEHF